MILCSARPPAVYAARSCKLKLKDWEEGNYRNADLNDPAIGMARGEARSSSRPKPLARPRTVAALVSTRGKARRTVNEGSMKGSHFTAGAGVHRRPVHYFGVLQRPREPGRGARGAPLSLFFRFLPQCALPLREGTEVALRASSSSSHSRTLAAVTLATRCEALKNSS